MSNNLKHVNYERFKTLYYVGLTGSMTQAGDAMCLCQSAITKQIQQLEAQLGYMLFYRDEKRMILTNEGRMIFELAAKMIHETDARIKDIELQRSGLRGELRILTHPSLATSWLPLHLVGFRDKYPEIRPVIASTTKPMNAFETDVMISSYIANNPNLIQHKLYDQVQGLFATKKYLETFGHPSSLEDLHGHRLLAIDRQKYAPFPHANWILKAGILDERNFRAPYMEYDGNEAAIHAMLLGEGIIAAGHHRIKMLKNPDVINILPHVKSEPTGVYLAHNINITKTEKYDALLGFLQQRIRELDQIYNDN